MLAFAFVSGALLIPGSGFTVGLGEIEVNSALNQELDAEIALLSTTAADAEQMIVKLASSEEFNRAGIDRPYLLTSLRFKIFDKNGEPWIKVTSPRPIREPFLNFLVEIDWPQGHLLREYTILLDPPVFMTSDQRVTSRPAAEDSSRPAASDASSSRPAAAPAPVVAPVAVPAASDDSATTNTSMVLNEEATYTRPAWAPSDGYRIQQGDTAWSLASKLRPDDSVTVEQMMIAMLRSNPEVFINNNVNGLKRGYILRVPDRDALGATSHNEAVALVREQAALWREYQSQLASGVPASSIATSADDSIGTDIDEGADARLNIVSAGSDDTMSGGDKDPTAMDNDELRAQLALANELLETERLEKEALVGKVDRLEGQVEKMQGMLNLEDTELADMQAAASEDILDEGAMEAVEDEAAAEDYEPVALDEVEEAAADADEMAVSDMVEDMEAELAGEADAASDEAKSLSGDEMDADTATGEEMDKVFVDETTDEQGTAMTEPEPQEAAPVVEPVADDFFQPAEPEGPLDAIMNNPTLLAAIGGGVVVIGGLIAFLLGRRNRKAEAEAPAAKTASVEDDLEEIADMVEDDALGEEISDDLVEAEMAEAEAEAEAEEEEFDTDSTMILPAADDTIITPEEDDAEEDERDDVIAEADVYLAYGIYQQAEELLNNAIAENPDSDAYRVKLAETHYASKNADAFVEAASGLKEQSGTDTKAWAKVAAMGKDLCPDNDMFTGGAMTGDVELDELMPKAPEMDIDLAGDGDADAAPDLDFSLDDDEEAAESPLDLPEADDATASLDIGDIEEPAASEDELEFDLSDTDAVEEEKPEEEEEFSLDIGADELDLGETSEAAADDDAEEEIDLSEDLEATAILDSDSLTDEVEEEASDDIDLDLGLDDAAEEPAEEEGDEIDISVADVEEAADIDLDLGLDDAAEEVAEEAAEEVVEAASDDIDLDLGLDDEAEEAVEAAADDAEDAIEDLDIDMDLGDDEDLGDLGDIDEVATKLDLARAYLDMGDSEGTRSILEEVISEGSDAQKKEAQDILDKL